jgi:hypothetical protein
VFQSPNPPFLLLKSGFQRTVLLEKRLNLGLQLRDPLAAGCVNVRFRRPSLHFAYLTPLDLKSTRATESLG